MESESKFVRETQIEPVAGIWACDYCGRKIQVVEEGDKPKVQSFICVCGTEMRPGEEHSVVDETVDTHMKNQVIDE